MKSQSFLIGPSQHILKSAIFCLIAWQFIIITVQVQSDWQNIANLVPGRNDNQCMYKWNQNHKSTITKTQWQKREDACLFQIISEKGISHWQDIAEELNRRLNVERNGKQCRERWFNFLNPSINREPFTEREDLIILTKRKQIGNRWSEIVKNLPGRTENQVKNRFNCLHKKARDELVKKKSSLKNMEDALKQIEHEAVQEVDEEEILTYMIEEKSKVVSSLHDTMDGNNDFQSFEVQPMNASNGTIGSAFIGPNDSIS